MKKIIFIFLTAISITALINYFPVLKKPNTNFNTPEHSSGVLQSTPVPINLSAQDETLKVGSNEDFDILIKRDIQMESETEIIIENKETGVIYDIPEKIKDVRMCSQIYSVLTKNIFYCPVVLT